MTDHKTTAATVGLLGLAAGAFAVGKRRGERANSRGAPPCQDPDCSEPASSESGYENCPDHSREFVEVPVDG